jgi:uncharacterized membrane protein YdfJ with MMPL/SSD domain
MIDENSPEKSPWGWKALIIFCILGALFLGFFYLAVTNEPDYMPSQKHKETTQQTAFKNAPTMTKEALDKAQADKLSREASAIALAEGTAEEHKMTESEHANMSQHGH